MEKNIAKIDNKTQILELNLPKEIKENTPKLELNLPPKFYFYPNAVNASKFIYSNNYQTISYNCNYVWYMINCSKPLPKNKISIYFKIEKTTFNNIMIGICPFSILKKTDANLYNSIGAYSYYSANGYIYYNGTYIASISGKGYTTGDVIKMTVNINENTIEWEKNNEIIHKMTMQSNLNEDIYPCVHFYDNNDKVSLINI